jgi:small-conductance mechanosensitive channel
MLGRLGAAVLTLILATAVYVALRRGLTALLERHAPYRFLAQRLLGWVYAPFVGLILLQELGVELGHLWTAVSALMALVAVGFVAAWSLLSNVSAAVMILSTRQFTLGDEVEVLEPTAREGLRGRVVDLNLIYTTLEQEAVRGQGRILVKLPNNIFFQKALRIRYGGAELPEPEVPEGTAAS